MNTVDAVKALADPELFEKNKQTVTDALVRELGEDQAKKLLKHAEMKRK